MKKTFIKSAVVLVAAWGCSLSLYAQSDGEGNLDPVQDRDRDGQVVAPTSPDNGVQDGVRLQLMDRLRASEQIREKLQDFEEQREAYLQAQQQLMRRLRGATEADREKLREMIQANRREWLDLAEQTRQQARDRVQQLREQLPSVREVMEAAREQAREQAQDQAREQVRDAVNAVRDRRGND